VRSVWKHGEATLEKYFTNKESGILCKINNEFINYKRFEVETAETFSVVFRTAMPCSLLGVL
jgi:hypothetical protein